MARPRTIPDSQVLGAVRDLMIGGGDRSVSFATVAEATGLAGSSLVQRFGSRDGMVLAALADGWQVLAARTDGAADEAQRSAKGVAEFLKQVARGDGGLVALLISRQREEDLRDAAEAWRARMEAELALRIGGGDAPKGKQREAAAMAFSAWLGRMVWDAAGSRGGAGFKLKTIARQLG